VIVGGVVSTTLTEKLHEPVLPARSIAVHDTGVLPRLNLDPLAGVHEKLARLASTMTGL
jgi:hypothetical protein